MKNVRKSQAHRGIFLTHTVREVEFVLTIHKIFPRNLLVKVSHLRGFDETSSVLFF